MRGLSCILALAGLAAAGKYPRFEDEMKYYKYKWEDHTVTTDDGYELVVFRITGKGRKTFKPDKPPVVIMDGQGGDASSWLESQAWNDMDKPFQLMLADSGYDVWLGSNRGSEYCQGHTTLDAAKDYEYWDFSFAEMGLYDDPAIIKYAVDNNNDFDKAFYIGYSQGTTQIFWSLSYLEDSFHKDYTYKVLAMATCFDTPYDFDAERYVEVFDQFDEYNVVALNGPEWGDDKWIIENEFDENAQEYAIGFETMGDAVKTDKHWI